MLRHVVFLRWQEGAGEEDKKRVEEGLAGLPGVIPEIKRYEFGGDAGLASGNFDFALVADFESQDDYETYQNHPQHLQVIQQAIKPVISERAAVQYWLTDSQG